MGLALAHASSENAMAFSPAPGPADRISSATGMLDWAEKLPLYASRLGAMALALLSCPSHAGDVIDL